MAASPPDPDPDLATTEAAMADTRRALAAKLDAVRDKLVALIPPPERTDTVPPKTAKPAASKTAPAKKPAAKKPARRAKPTLAEAALAEVKEVAKDVLTGAAAGAVRGAAQAAAGHVEEGAEKVEQVAAAADKKVPKKPAAKVKGKG